MKKALFILLVMFYFIPNGKAQATLDSISVTKYPDFRLLCGDSTCEDGRALVHVSNATTPYLMEVFYLNGTPSLIFQQYWTSNGSFPKTVCRDSLLFVLTDTSFNTKDSLYLYPVDLLCPFDTIYAHPIIRIDRVDILRADTVYSTPDTVPTGKVRIWPSGGHMPGYVYRLDTVTRGSSPQPPTSSNPGYNVYRNWQDSAIYDSLFWRWYGVSCIDTSRLVPILKVKAGFDCVLCGDSLPTDSIEPFWFYVPPVSKNNPKTPKACKDSSRADCDPFTGTDYWFTVFGGMPPYTVSVNGIAQPKVYNYSGTYIAPVTIINCQSVPVVITDSLGFVNCTYVAVDKKEADLLNISLTPAFLDNCCNGHVTFSFYTGCGGTNTYTIFGPTFFSGTIVNGQVITISNLCPGNYWLTDSTGCISESFTIAMLDRPCPSDSAIGIGELLSPIKNMNVFPNPSTGDLTITFNSGVAVDSDIILEVSDLSGRKVMKKLTQWLGVGKFERTLDISNLDAGNYLVTVRINEAIARKIIVKK